VLNKLLTSIHRLPQGLADGFPVSEHGPAVVAETTKPVPLRGGDHSQRRDQSCSKDSFRVAHHLQLLDYTGKG
jgi:hypothetical protein